MTQEFNTLMKKASELEKKGLPRRAAGIYNKAFLAAKSNKDEKEALLGNKRCIRVSAIKIPESML
ncbi:hypothetical protein [Xenorhabdus bovienii]|uniref:hypothetical protein n=1 Tax=Xenorhabdus bovienii TaxID=40576 RepID=UPI003DA60FC3